MIAWTDASPACWTGPRAYGGVVKSPQPDAHDRDEPVAIPLDPEEALKALLAVNPDDEPKDGEQPEEG